MNMSKLKERLSVSKEEYAHFPDDISRIVKIIQGLVVHRERVRNESKKPQTDGVETHSIKELLTLIKKTNPKSLSNPRSYEQKVIVICRQYAMLLTSILTSKGLKARARCGFATYFQKDWYEDHWICEYYSKEQKRWIKVDPQLDAYFIKKLKINKKEINPLDINDQQFLTGTEMWKKYRRGEIDPTQCGFSPLNEKGEWYIRGNLLRDFYSLKGIPLKYSEETKLMSKSHKPNNNELTHLDKIARAILTY